MKYLFILLSLVFFSVNSEAQNNIKAKGRISGKVIDASTKQPIDYATIRVFKEGTTTLINGMSSDAGGKFTVDNLPDGAYQVVVDFIGYQNKKVDHVVIGADTRSIALGTIVLSSASNQLKGVTISASAPIVENKIDKMVYNAANDLTSQGGVAIDVLRKVPQVTVDIDGNVELQGNANIRFLINGKPSSIFGASLADALQSIPASQIKSIEVITSPGAKYDASGTGGIINIVLKDSKVEGMNGSVNLSAGTRLENGSVNLNARKGNFGVNAYLSGNAQLNTTILNTVDRHSYNSTRDTITRLLQDGSSAFKRRGYQTGISFNWSITKKDELTGSFGFKHFDNSNSGLTNQQQTVQNLSNSLLSEIISLRNSSSDFSSNSFDHSLNYKKTFAKDKQELNVLYTASYGKNLVDVFQQQDYQTAGQPSTGLMSRAPGKDRETDISVDYTQPVSKDLTLETGAKMVFESLSNAVTASMLSADGSYVPDLNRSYGFDYSRKIYAYYLSASFSLFNGFLEGKAGLRDEYTSMNRGISGAKIPGYNILAPSFVLLHKIDETQSIKASYTRRIERPEYRDLDPFYNISDPHNISTGNPNLKPELGNNFELGYNKSFKGGANIYVAAFYRHNTDDLQSYTTFFPTLDVNGTIYNNVFLNQRSNIGSESTPGISLFGSVPVTSKLSLRSNMIFSDRITNNPGNPSVSGFAYRINLNCSYQFGNDLTAEVFGNYNSSQRVIQGTRPAFIFYNLAIRKQFLNKKASVGLTAASPFSSYVNQRSVTNGDYFDQSSVRRVPFRSFGISLSYKFGKLEFKKSKDKEDNNMPGPIDN